MPSGSLLTFNTSGLRIDNLDNVTLGIHNKTQGVEYNIATIFLGKELDLYAKRRNYSSIGIIFSIKTIEPVFSLFVSL